nr:unnamed protein product [Digitaria exilis]
MGQVFHYGNANTTGQAILEVRGLIHEWHWYWVCVGVLFGFSLIFNILSIFALEFLKSPKEHSVNTKSQKVQDIQYVDQSVRDQVSTSDQVNLPFHPLSVVFNQINYFVDMPSVNSLPHYS